MLQLLLQQVRASWEAADTFALNPASTHSLALFEQQQGVVLPADLRAYFLTLNGTGEADVFIRFTSLAEFRPLPALLADFPRDFSYHQLLTTLPAPEQVFVFADYIFFLYAYAIRLSPTPTAQHEVYLLCGGEYQLLSPSFRAFLELYLRDDQALYFAGE